MLIFCFSIPAAAISHLRLPHQGNLLLLPGKAWFTKPRQRRQPAILVKWFNSAANKQAFSRLRPLSPTHGTGCLAGTASAG